MTRKGSTSGERIHDQKLRQKRRIFRRDDFTCVSCGFRPQKLPGAHWDGRGIVGERSNVRADDVTNVWDKAKYWSNYLTLDHIFEQVLGGVSTDNNLQVLCNKCNSAKSFHISKLLDRIRKIDENGRWDNQDAAIILAIELGVAACPVGAPGTAHRCGDTTQHPLARTNNDVLPSSHSTEYIPRHATEGAHHVR